VYEFGSLAEFLDEFSKDLGQEDGSRTSSISNYSLEALVEVSKVSTVDGMRYAVDRLQQILKAIWVCNFEKAGRRKGSSDEEQGDPTEMIAYAVGHSERYSEIRLRWRPARFYCVCQFAPLFRFCNKTREFQVNGCDACGSGPSKSSRKRKFGSYSRPAYQGGETSREEDKSWEEVLGVVPGEMGSSRGGLMRCKRCKAQDCSYKLVATRSGDEGMTAFCFCRQCRHSWKMSV